MTLFQHQLDGAEWLTSRKRAYLGDEPGTGKTRTILEAIRRSGSSNTLVITPAIVRTHWRREADLIGVQPLVYSYDGITRGGFPLMKSLLDEGIDSLVLDEAHYAKHAGSQRAQILLGKDGYARRLDRVWLASGTPMPRNPAELWPQLVNLIPSVLMAHQVYQYDAWLARFCITSRVNARGVWRDKVVGVQNADELKAILGEVMLARSLGDLGIDVPEMFWQTLTLDPARGDEFDFDYQMPREDHRGLKDHIRAGTLADIAQDPHVARMRRRLGELKVAPVLEMLREQLTNSDEKVVVFAHHRTVLNALREGLRAFGVSYVDGDVGDTARNVAIDMFQSTPLTRVFIGQNVACQTGITLTAAHRMVLVEPDWDANVNYQLGKRIARIGQKERCIGQLVALAGTLDEAIVRQNERETRMVAEVMS